MIHSDGILTALLVLSVARVTHLVTKDAILDRPRAWVGRRVGRAGTWLAYLIQCPWCVSIWLGAGMAAITYNCPTAWWVDIPLLLLTSSYVAGMLEQVEAVLTNVTGWLVRH